jgi:hypothetical protein
MKRDAFVRMAIVSSVVAVTGLTTLVFSANNSLDRNGGHGPVVTSEPIAVNAARMISEGRKTFRFDTFGDEAFWGDQLQLHRAIEGTNFGGVGPGVSPKAALDLGLKVDAEALPIQTLQQIKKGRVNLDDPAVTLQLLKLNAVVGVQGFFNPNGSLKSVGLTCAVCHSTVNDSVAPGIGQRLDGWANHDLDTGAIIAAAPNLAPITQLLSIVHPGITDDQVRAVLNTWGPGKFDAELLLDGKAFNPQQVTGGVVTGTNVPGATLIPNAFDLAGYNLHTWGGGWGTVTYWNAFVAVLELRGIGTFFDERLDDTNKYPIAATARFGHISVPPDQDRVTPTLPALHFYFIFINSPFRRRNQAWEWTSMSLRPSVAMRCSAERRTVIVAIVSRCGPSQAGTITRPRKCALIHFRPIARRTANTRLRLFPHSSFASADCS